MEFVYFGSGDGASSWIRWPLVQVRRLVQRRSTDTSPTVRPPGQGSTAQSAPRSKPIVAARVVWALTLAWEKRAKLRRAARSRARGVVVICDRFPQAQVGGIMDGPLLHTWQERPRGLRKRVAAWEARPYRLAERQPPDLVLRLLVDQAHAERRRPDHDSADLRRRREIVGSLRFDGVPYLVDLDATLPADAVLASAMAAVAHCLDQRASGSTPKEK